MTNKEGCHLSQGSELTPLTHHMQVPVLLLPVPPSSFSSRARMQSRCLGAPSTSGRTAPCFNARRVGRVAMRPAAATAAPAAAGASTSQGAKDLKFWKYQGLGNDFILVRAQPPSAHNEA